MIIEATTEMRDDNVRTLFDWLNLSFIARFDKLEIIGN
jgi:hypothetical protein